MKWLSFLISFVASTVAFCSGSKAVEGSILRIVAEGCGKRGDNTNIQTGFVLEDYPNHIVTALHGVAHCAKISAVLTQNGPLLFSAEIDQVDFDRDVALLSVSPGLSVDGLSGTGDVSTRAYSRAVIHGFPQGIVRQKAIGVVVPHPPLIQLRLRIPANSYSAFLKYRSPSPLIDVVEIDGDAQIGQSGAPLVDPATDRVIGVVSGGPGLGQYGFGWAIPLHDLVFSRYDHQADEVQALKSRTLSSNFALAATSALTSRERRILYYVGGVSLLGNPRTACAWVELSGPYNKEFARQVNVIASEIEAVFGRELAEAVSAVTRTRRSADTNLVSLLGTLDTKEQIDLVLLGYYLYKYLALAVTYHNQDTGPNTQRERSCFVSETTSAWDQIIHYAGARKLRDVERYITEFAAPAQILGDDLVARQVGADVLVEIPNSL